MHNILDNYILNIPIFMIYKLPFEYQCCYQREVKLLTLTLRFMLNVVLTLKFRQLFNICHIYMHFLYYFNTLKSIIINSMLHLQQLQLHVNGTTILLMLVKLTQIAAIGICGSIFDPTLTDGVGALARRHLVQRAR